MITVSISYPFKQGATFDYDYYLNKHIPATIEVIKNHPEFKGITVERGVSGAAPGSEPGYVAMCRMKFASQKGFMEAFMPHAAELNKDVPNYTDIKPQTQINKVEVIESEG